MTVQFNTTTINPTVELFDNLYEELKKQTIKTAPPKQLKQVDSIYLIRVYKTFSEKQPVKWEPYDLQTCTGATADDLTASLNEWVHHCKKQAEWHGYKILTMHVDLLNVTATVLNDYCVEHWQPKEKVYINGPKKKPFPTKAAKHYV